MCINEPESDDDKHRHWVKNLRLMCLQSPYYIILYVIGIQVLENNQRGGKSLGGHQCQRVQLESRYH